MPTISIHTTLAGGDEKALNKARVIASISIHTTLAGGDRKSELEDIIWRTISIHTTLAGGDWRICMRQQVFWISIHTTLAGGDCSCSSMIAFTVYFNPHHPRGWRHTLTLAATSSEIFQSTPPSRVATVIPAMLISTIPISIHTTLAGGDNSAIVCPSR